MPATLSRPETRLEAAWFQGRLRELREAAGLSRKQLAERAGLRSEKGIRDLEQGRRNPTWETVLALCKALSVKPDAFAEKPAEGEPEKPKGGRPKKTPPADDAEG